MTREQLKAVGRWSERFLKTLAVFSVIWSLILVRVGKDELSLLVWIQADSIVYPSEVTREIALPFVFEGDSTRSVRISQVRVANYGTESIGTPDSLWVLEFEAPEGSRLSLLSSAIKLPPTTVVRAPIRPRANILQLPVGVFQRKATIDLILLLVNAPKDTYVPFKVRPSLPGLPHDITLRPPSDRLAERLYSPVFVTALITLLAFGGKGELEAAMKNPSAGKRRLSLVGRAVGLLLMAAITAVLIAKGLGHVVSWFL